MDSQAEKGAGALGADKVGDPLTPGRGFSLAKGVFGLGVLDSDPPLSHVLVKAAWMASGQPSWGRNRDLNLPRCLARMMDFCWVELHRASVA